MTAAPNTNASNRASVGTPERAPRNPPSFAQLRAPLLATGLLALALRVYYLTDASGNPFWRSLGLDMEIYDLWARVIVEQGGMGQAPFTQAPLFPLLLSLAYRFSGSDPVGALWSHVVPGVAAVMLATWVAGRWRGPVAAWATGILLAAYKPAIFYTGVLLPPVWVMAFSALFLFAANRVIERGAEVPIRPLLSAGFAVGLLALGQPVALVLAIPFAWFLFRGWQTSPRRLPARTQAQTQAPTQARTQARTQAPSPKLSPKAKPKAAHTPKRKPDSKRAKKAALTGLLSPRARVSWFAAGLLVPLLLTLFYNGSSGAWSWVSVNGGINLYIGNGPEANGAYVRPAGMEENRDLLGVQIAREAVLGDQGTPLPGSRFTPGGDFGVGDANRYWTRRALGEMFGHPIRTLTLLGRKLQFFAGQYEIPQVESMPFESRYSRLLQLPLPGMGLLLVLATIGAGLPFGRDRTSRWLAWSVLAFAVGVSLFFVTARFRLPIAPWLGVLAGGGVAILIEYAKDRSVVGNRSLLAAGAAAVVAAALTSINLAGIDADAAQGQYAYRLGVIAERDGEVDKAIGHYELAIEIDDTLAKAHVNLGTLLARKGDLAGARPLLERGVALDPSSGTAQQNLGQLHQVQGRDAEARLHYEKALAAEEDLLSARESLAYLLHEEGEIQESRKHLQTIQFQAPEGSLPRQRSGTLMALVDERRQIAARSRGDGGDSGGPREPDDSGDSGIDPRWEDYPVLLEADVLLCQRRIDEAMARYREAADDPRITVYASDVLRQLEENLNRPSSPGSSQPPDPSERP